MPRHRATAKKTPSVTDANTTTTTTTTGEAPAKGVHKRRHANTKRKVRIIPVIPMMSRDVYKRLSGKNRKGEDAGRKCGNLTRDTAIVSNMEELKELGGTAPVLQATRRRAARRLQKLILRQLMFQHDPERFPLSIKDRSTIEAIGLTYYLDNSRKIKDDAKPENTKFNAFLIDVANTTPNVSDQAIKSLSTLTMVASEDIIKSSADLAFRAGQQTVGAKQVHCLERLALGPRVGNKMVNGKYDLSRCPTDQRILSASTHTIV